MFMEVIWSFVSVFILLILAESAIFCHTRGKYFSADKVNEREFLSVGRNNLQRMIDSWAELLRREP